MRYQELNEKKAHGSAEFPIEYYKVDPQHPRYVMDAHWHTEIEVLRVEHGQFDLYLNRRHYTLRAGDLAFINGGTIHHGEGEACMYECAVFRADMLLPQSGVGAVSRYIKPIVRRRHEVREYIPCGESKGVDAKADELFSLLREPHEGVELAVTGVLFGLFYELYRGGMIEELPTGKGQDKQLEQLAALLGWIEEHYTERITLETLSKTSGLNEKYLCRFFKAYTAHTPIDYVNRLRVERAAEDLRTGRCSVTEAAYANGFNDSAYFTKIFHRIKGVPPAAYRRSCERTQG